MALFGNPKLIAEVVLVGQDKINAGLAKIEEKGAGMADKVKGAIAGIGPTMLAAAAGYGAMRLLGWFGQAAEAAANFQQSIKGLGAQMGMSVEETKGYVNQLQEIVKGQVSLVDLTSATNRAVALLGKEAIPRFNELADVALRASKVMGISVTQAFDDIVTGIGRQSRMILDNLGIIVSVTDANKKYADALGVTVGKLTDADKKQAFLNETLKQGADKFREIDIETMDAAEEIAAMRAKVDDLKVEVGDKWLPVHKAWLGLLTETIELLQGTTQEIGNLFDLSAGFRTWSILVNDSFGNAQWAVALFNAEVAKTGNLKPGQLWVAPGFTPGGGPLLGTPSPGTPGAAAAGGGDIITPAGLAELEFWSNLEQLGIGGEPTVVIGGKRYNKQDFMKRYGFGGGGTAPGGGGGAAQTAAGMFPWGMGETLGLGDTGSAIARYYAGRPQPESLSLGAGDISPFALDPYYSTPLTRGANWGAVKRGAPRMLGSLGRALGFPIPMMGDDGAAQGRGGFMQDTQTQVSALAQAAGGNIGGAITSILGSTALLGSVMGPFAPLLGLFAGPLDKLFGGGRRPAEAVEPLPVKVVNWDDLQSVMLNVTKQSQLRSASPGIDRLNELRILETQVGAG